MCFIVYKHVDLCAKVSVMLEFVIKNAIFLECNDHMLTLAQNRANI